MTIYDLVKKKLEDHPNFRERRFRGPLLAKLAARDLGLEARIEAGIALSFADIDSLARKHDSYRHEYDAVQRDYEHLRGQDYPDKKRLVQEKQIEFGYQPNYHADMKKLAEIES